MILTTDLYKNINLYAVNYRLYQVITSITLYECEFVYMFDNDIEKMSKCPNIIQVFYRYRIATELLHNVKYLFIMGEDFPIELSHSLILLYCSYIRLSYLPNLPETLRVLQCGNNPILNLPVLPDGLEILDCSSTHINTLPSILPSKLRVLECRNNNNISSLPKLPQLLLYIDIANTSIRIIPDLPLTLLLFDFESPYINYCPQLPSSIRKIKCNSFVKIQKELLLDEHFSIKVRGIEYKI